MGQDFDKTSDSVQIVQNDKIVIFNEKLNWTSYTRAKQSSKRDVQNEGNRCPKWGLAIENGKLKVENEKHKTLCSTTI